MLFLDTDVVTDVTSQMIKKETQLDPVLAQVYNYVISGWPHVVDSSLVPFKTRQEELSTRHGCLSWGARVIVPPSLQEKSPRDFSNESFGAILCVMAQHGF